MSTYDPYAHLAGIPMLQSREFAPTMDYYIPQWEERTSYGMRRIDPYTKLFEDRIIFLGTPISDEIANAVMAQLLCLQQMDCRAADRHLHQLPRRLVHGADRDLRHDALHQARREHGLPRSGRLGGGGDPGRRHQGASGSPCRTAGS